jgi:hypothetical protein
MKGDKNMTKTLIVTYLLKDVLKKNICEPFERILTIPIEETKEGIQARVSAIEEDYLRVCNSATKVYSKKDVYIHYSVMGG